MRRRFLPAAFGLLLVASVGARAQSRVAEHKFEVGALFTTLDMRDSTSEKPGGVGARFTYNVNEYFALDSELTRFPESGGGNFGLTQGLFGVKAGRRFASVPVGLFVKARPGFVTLGDTFTVRNPGSTAKFATDLGGVLELYPSRRTVLRIDAGQTLISFGDTPVNSATRPPRSIGTAASTQVSIGFSYRF